ncbi:unnamed protein product [Staurois parvus]|uniref:Uncharacterized protein n=1 Tax=Staurois parvus TaxID=386267 RepID=A0ABN9GUS9_9NEOB|nr:unnamed protein product [Staurois parvus]
MYLYIAPSIYIYILQLYQSLTLKGHTIKAPNQGRTDHFETRAMPKGPGCPWYLFHRLF